MKDAVFLTDLHLGSGMCQVKPLLSLLKNLPKTQRLILGGDVLESINCRLSRKHWEVLDCLRSIAKHDEVVWVKGNHDGDAQAVASLIGASFVTDYIFETGGIRCLVVHGDRWDDFTTNYPVTTFIADFAYVALQKLHEDLARAAKQRSKVYLETALKVQLGATRLAEERCCLMVLCGHTHHAEAYPVGPISYVNGGCWTEKKCHFVTVKDGVAKLKEVN